MFVESSRNFHDSEEFWGNPPPDFASELWRLARFSPKTGPDDLHVRYRSRRRQAPKNFRERLQFLLH